MKLNRVFIVKRVLPVFAGGLLGYAYYYFIGCNSGSCAIQSNPYLTIAYGAMMGSVFAFPGSEKKNSGKTGRTQQQTYINQQTDINQQSDIRQQGKKEGEF